MVYNEICHREIDWCKAMKQILIKLAALGLLFSVVSTYACDTCGSNKARESINVHDVEGKHIFFGYPVNEDGKKLSAEEPPGVGHPRKCREQRNCPYPPGY